MMNDCSLIFWIKFISRKNKKGPSMSEARRKTLFYRFARLGLDVAEKERTLADKSMSAFRVRGVMAAARQIPYGPARLTLEMRSELVDALTALSAAHDARTAGFPIDVPLTLDETKRAAEILANHVRRFGASAKNISVALVAHGSSSDKAAYVIEAACEAKRKKHGCPAGCSAAVQYVPVSREWLVGKRTWGRGKKLSSTRSSPSLWRSHRRRPLPIRKSWSLSTTRLHSRPCLRSTPCSSSGTRMSTRSRVSSPWWTSRAARSTLSP